MPTTFVTGANSFLGAHLIYQLLARGHHVRGLVRASSNSFLLKNIEIEYIEGDLLQPGSWRNSLKGCDALFHVAASFTHDPHLIANMRTVNIRGTQALLTAAWEAGIPRIVHTSTIGTIGQPAKNSRLATEETPFNLPNPSAYVLSKRAGEQIADDLAQQGAPVIIVHPTAMLGAGDWRPTASGRIVQAWMKQESLRYITGGINWTPVQDVAVGMILAQEKGIPGRHYILGHAQGNLDETAFRALMARASGQPTPPTPQHSWKNRLQQWLHPPTPAPQRTTPQRLTCNPQRAITELDMPQSDLLEAASQEIAWYQAMGL